MSEQDAVRASEVLEFLGKREAAHKSWAEPRCWGLSSDALAWFGAGQSDEPTERDYPSDPSDLMACTLTYRMAPEWMKPKLAPVLEKMQHHVEKRYPEATLRVEAYLAGDRSEWATWGSASRGAR